MKTKQTITKNLTKKDETDFVDFFFHIYEAYKSLESCEDPIGALFLINNVFEDSIKELMEFNYKNKKGKS